ncbi:tryptophan-rich sensory protein [Sphaerospermopsis aphanizomenoides BCCUSP55]|uniref:tryptophan-rich sensory protein n=1 Tax=Sphaerospermopsis aphanizomenoides TaxID=459663 RepID=UPI000A8444B9|nr:tryptophan-rich sensory protein [Sphaerospermopsis aphanizomenoides]MBK1988795.1 tryptophan-rich sensory protein [Sphaerospermopsis aphanizomenoides BCCUSP55]
MQQSSSGNNQDFIRQITTLGAIVGAFIVNVVSNIFPLNGLNIGAISNTLFKDVLIIPANYAFAIWGLIYLGLFALGIYQFLPSQKNDDDLRKTGYLLVIASVSQSIWVYLFLGRFFTLSIVAMLGILIPLIIIHQRLEIGSKRVSRIKKFCLHAPISIYLSWISVATIVNVACALYFYNWNSWGITNEVWTVIMLLAAAAISSVMVIKYQDIPYTGVTVWALVAIALKHWDNSLIRNVAILLAIALMIIAITKSWRR